LEAIAVSGTKRIPIARRHAPPISPTAVAIFGEMMQCACTCPDDFDFVRDQHCPGCQKYRELERHLHHELKLRPWQKTVEDPRAEVHPTCQADEQARQRWLTLEAALRERQDEARAVAPR